MGTLITDLAAKLNAIDAKQAEAYAENVTAIASLQAEIADLRAQLGMVPELPPDAEEALQRVEARAQLLADQNPPVPGAEPPAEDPIV